MNQPCHQGWQISRTFHGAMHIGHLPPGVANRLAFPWRSSRGIVATPGGKSTGFSVAQSARDYCHQGWQSNLPSSGAVVSASVASGSPLQQCELTRE
jgi:hypothetical protein